MRESFYFSPKEQLTFQLDPGESIVDIKIPLTGTKEKDNVTVVVNGQDIHFASRPSMQVFAPESLSLEGVTVSVIANSSGTFAKAAADPEGVVLASASLWPTEREPEGLSLVLRPSGKQ